MYNTIEVITMTVLITGSSRGIGAATARAFAAGGYDVAVNYNKNRDKAEALALELREKYNVLCEAFEGDVSDSASVKAMFENIRKSIGEVDVLVNNAGVSSQKLFTDISDSEWRECVGVSLDGAFYCSREALPHMIREKSGVIINISSMWGEVGASCEAHYSAAKSGLIGLTKALAKEVGPSGIRVNCVAPGVVMTDMMKSFDAQTVEELKEDTPLCRLGTPDDIADAVLFLAGDRAKFITGQVLSVNGGFVI
jgi:3-oxoacyl-[acyl-carrier protein] reductase